MNYRHGYHAGNFADVVKHLAMVAILLHLKKKDTGFAVLDSHAGRGLYDLTSEESRKTGEAGGGIARLAGLADKGSEVLSVYRDLAAQSGEGKYPGSPLIAARMLRPQDRLTAIEKHADECAALKETLAPFRNAAAECGDGYGRIVKLLPPTTRRGLVLMDPPFEAPDEFEALARGARAAWRKFATGIYLIWYPVKSQPAADGFVAEVLAEGVTQAVTVDAQIAAPEGKLARSGLLVLNPPWGFEAAMAAALSVAAPAMDAQTRIHRVAGSDQD